MPRIRTIKPEFWISEQVTGCCVHARLLFIGLLNFCDDHGVHPAEARRLKMEVFPGDPVGIKKITRWVDELINAGLLQEFEAQGRRYWFVTGWKHQRIDKSKAIYKYPLPPDSCPKGVEDPATRGPARDEPSTTRSPISAEEGITDSKGKEGSGIGEYGKGEECGNPYPEDFERTWSKYPKRAGNNPKPDGFRAWDGRRKAGQSVEAMESGAERYQAYCKATDVIGTEFVMQAKRFFGPDQLYLQKWDLPRERKPKGDLERAAEAFRRTHGSTSFERNNPARDDAGVSAPVRLPPKG